MAGPGFWRGHSKVRHLVTVLYRILYVRHAVGVVFSASLQLHLFQINSTQPGPGPENSELSSLLASSLSTIGRQSRFGNKRRKKGLICCRFLVPAAWFIPSKRLQVISVDTINALIVNGQRPHALISCSTSRHPRGRNSITLTKLAR
jgi:hypothetical protein